MLRSWGGGVFGSYLFPRGRAAEARASWFSSHSRRGGRSARSGGGSPGLALEPVGADGSGSQSSRRSCGTPGTSGRCQARGPAPEGGRSILPPPTPPGLWLLLAGERSPSPGFFWSLLPAGEGRRGQRKPKHPSWVCGEGSGPSAIDLEKGRAHSSPQPLSSEMEMEEDPLPPLPQPRLLGSAREADRPLGR